MCRLGVCCCMLVLGFAGLACADTPSAKAPPLDPQLPYQAKRAHPVTYDVDFAVVVTPPYHTNILKVWLPLPQSDRGQEVASKELSSFPLVVKPQLGKEKTHGNQFAYFEFHKPEGAQMIRHRFKVTVWELHWGVEADKVVPVPRWPAVFAPYLRSDQSVVVDARVRKALQEAVAISRGASQDMVDIMTWVNRTMKYDHDHASLRASAAHALDHHVGHCSDYHGLCASFGRALGYPTRVTYGINPFPKNSPSHCKLEVYMPPYGWVSFDVSETQKLLGKIAQDNTLDARTRLALSKAVRKRLASGFRDNTWYCQTRGTDYDLEPRASRKVAVVRTAYVEADGQPLPEPDPANSTKREFSWMTLHRYTPDRAVKYPFADWSDLLPR